MCLEYSVLDLIADLCKKMIYDKGFLQARAVLPN